MITVVSFVFASVPSAAASFVAAFPDEDDGSFFFQALLLLSPRTCVTGDE